MSHLTFSQQILRHKLLVQLVCCVGLCWGCGEKKKHLPGEEVVLAEVNEQAITAWDLRRALNQSLGKFAVPSVQKGATKSALESLIQSRAIAHLAWEKLSEGERLVLEKEVAAYRESLLVKSYLAKESKLAPVSSQEVKAYYDEHQTRWGAGKDRRYELIFVTKPLGGTGRTPLLKALSEAAQLSDWKAESQKWGTDGDLGYAQGLVSESNLHPKLKQQLEALSVGKGSNVILVQERAYIGRITEEVKKPAKPLSEVREEILRSLELARQRDAIRAVGVKATQAVKIVRHGEVDDLLARAARETDK